MTTLNYIPVPQWETIFGSIVKNSQYDGTHRCESPGCLNTVGYDDEPCCFEHSPDAGSFVKGYSFRRGHPNEVLPDVFMITMEVADQEGEIYTKRKWVEPPVNADGEWWDFILTDIYCSLQEIFA